MNKGHKIIHFVHIKRNKELLLGITSISLVVTLERGLEEGTNRELIFPLSFFFISF